MNYTPVGMSNPNKKEKINLTKTETQFLFSNPDEFLAGMFKTRQELLL